MFEHWQTANIINQLFVNYNISPPFPITTLLTMILMRKFVILRVWSYLILRNLFLRKISCSGYSWSSSLLIQNRRHLWHSVGVADILIMTQGREFWLLWLTISTLFIGLFAHIFFIAPLDRHPADSEAMLPTTGLALTEHERRSHINCNNWYGFL